MYAPEQFKETDLERLEALVRDYPFGMLVTINDGVPFVNHIPFSYERRTSDTSLLLGHVARANPQWHHLASGQTALAVFQGPHAYISPSWYGTPGVPTWNYAVVHVHGKARILEDEAEARNLLERLTATHETSHGSPWEANFTRERWAELLGHIVGFEILAEKIEGKFKLSQNRPAEDQQAVANRLAESNLPLSVEVAGPALSRWRFTP